jgi:hypothetical protein
MVKKSPLNLIQEATEKIKSEPTNEGKAKKLSSLIKDLENEKIETPIPTKEKSPKLKIKNSPIKVIKKPVTEKQKKDIKKVSEVVKKELPKTVIPEIKEIPKPKIDYTIEETTMYGVNWFYCRKLFIKFCNLLVYPYIYYAAWFNRTFNRPKIIKDLENKNKEMQAKIIRKSIEMVSPKKNDDGEWQDFKPETYKSPEIYESDK